MDRPRLITPFLQRQPLLAPSSRFAGIFHGRQTSRTAGLPVTKGPLRFDREHQELISHSARLAYPVRDGIPVLLENEARTLSDDELEEEKQ